MVKRSKLNKSILELEKKTNDLTVSGKQKIETLEKNLEAKMEHIKSVFEEKVINYDKNLISTLFTWFIKRLRLTYS